MRGKYATFVLFVNIFYDILCINVALLIASTSFLQTGDTHYIFLSKYYLIVFPVINILWVIAAQIGNIYSSSILVYFKIGMTNSLKAYGLFVLLLSFWVIFFLNRAFFSKQFLLKYFILFGVLFFIARAIFYFLKKLYDFEFLDKKRVLLVGDEEMTSPIKQTILTKTEYGYQYCGSIANTFFETTFENSAQQLLEEVKNNNIQEVFFVKPKMNNTLLYDLIRKLDAMAVRTKIVPDFFDFYRKPQRLSFLDQTPILYVRDEPLESLLNRTIKRCFDVVFSLFVIIFIFSWLFPILAILIKLSSNGPVFFKQLRPGKDNQPFVCYKFRSMKLNKESTIAQTSINDPRVTKIGSFIRKTSIDELPQFFNVLLGNMSIVGPRPQLLHHPQEYASIVEKYMIRHLVKPGITGWAQVNGHRGPITDVDEIQKRVALDVWYIENWSFILDIQIILMTVYNILKKEKEAY